MTRTLVSIRMNEEEKALIKKRAIEHTGGDVSMWLRIVGMYAAIPVPSMISFALKGVKKRKKE